MRKKDTFQKNKIQTLNRTLMCSLNLLLRSFFSHRYFSTLNSRLWRGSSLTAQLSIQKGFTLIELLVVIVIIGVLATMGIVNFLDARVRARDAQRKANLHQLQAAFELYRHDRLTYPPAPLPACNTALSNSGTIYMQKIPCDPTNSGQFTYRYVTNGTTYSLIACLENENDAQKDATNNGTYCAGGTTNWSYTLTNP